MISECLLLLLLDVPQRALSFLLCCLSNRIGMTSELHGTQCSLGKKMTTELI